MKQNLPQEQSIHPRELDEQGLLRERERLEVMLKTGSLSGKDAIRLRQTRRALERIADLKSDCEPTEPLNVADAKAVSALASAAARNFIR